MTAMKTKILVIAIIYKDDAVLLRKKPEGSEPYEQTWYLFGGELTDGQAPEEAVAETLRLQAGIEVRFSEALAWDTEVKADHDGEVKQFVYLDARFEYVSGEIKAGEGIEKVEWAPISRLGEYDHVPPSAKLFRKLGYI